MATIREWLNDAGFDWLSGRIVWQAMDADAYCPGWGSPISGQYIDSGSPILDEQFYAGFGAPRCPRFIARDNRAIYYPCQYDGSTWIESIVIDLDRYVGTGNDLVPSPYPGG